MRTIATIEPRVGVALVLQESNSQYGYVWIGEAARGGSHFDVDGLTKLRAALDVEIERLTPKTKIEHRVVRTFAWSDGGDPTWRIDPTTDRVETREVPA